MNDRNQKSGDELKTEERGSSESSNPKRMVPYRLLCHIVWGSGGTKHYPNHRVTLRIGRLRGLFNCSHDYIWNQLYWLEEQGFLEIMAKGRGIANIRIMETRLL